jgi:hypothetical protein
MSNIPSIGIYYKPYQGSYLDVTGYIDPASLPAWEEKTENQFVEFSLTLDAPKDVRFGQPGGNYIMLKNDGELLITKTKDRQALLDDSLTGVIKVQSDSIIDFGDSEEELEVKFDLTVHQKNFSLGIFEINFSNTSSLSSILTYIFQYTTGLGGYKLDGAIIDKFYLPSNLDIDVPPFIHTGQAIDVLNTLCGAIGYGYRIEGFIEPDPVNLINHIKYVRFFEKNLEGYPLQNPIFANGITRETLKQGLMKNPYYDPENRPNEPQFILTELDTFRYEVDSTNMVNYLKLIAFVIPNQYTLTRKDFNRNENSTQFPVGRAADIVYIARPVLFNKVEEDEDNYRITAVVSENEVTVDSDGASLVQFDADRLYDNGLGTALVFRVYSNGSEYHREGTISGNNITFTKGTIQYPSSDGSIPGLTFSDTNLEVELINGYDVLRPNRPTYPSDADGYVIKNVQVNQDSYFTMQDVDSPDALNPLVAYVYAVNDYSQNFKFLDEIKRYGQYFETQEINYNVTETEIENILNEEKKRLKPLEKVSFSTYRPGDLVINSKMPVVVRPLVDGVFFVSSVKNEFVTWDSPHYNEPLLKRDVELVSYLEDSLALALARSQIRSEIAEALLNQNELEIYNFTLEYQFDSDIPQAGSPVMTVLKPTGLNTTNITSSGFKANWTNPQVYDSLGIYITTLEDNFTDSDPIIISGTDTYYDFTGLDPDQYKWRLNAIVGTSQSGFVTSEIVNLNLNLAVDLNFGNGSLSDRSGNNNNLIVNDVDGNGAEFTNNPIISGDTQSFYVDGQNDQAYINYAASLDSASFTQEIIFQIVSSESYLGLSSRFDLTLLDGTNAIYTTQYYSNKLSIVLYDSSYNGNVSGSNTKYIELVSSVNNNLTINTTYTLQVSFNNSTKALLVKLNGVELSMVYAGGGISSLSSLNINQKSTRIILNGFVDGTGYNENNPAYSPELRLARFRYWTKALTSSEMTNSYNQMTGS